MNDEWRSAAEGLLEANRENRASVGLSQETDLSVLQIAALYDSKLAREMLKTGIDCDLHSACALGQVIADLCKTSDLATEVDGLPAMGFAVLKSQLHAIKTLLAYGDDPNRAMSRIGFFVWEDSNRDRGMWRPLHMVAAHGYAEHAAQMTRVLVEADGDFNASCVLGEQPLHLACTYGWLDVMQTLLDLGAHIDSRTEPCNQRVFEVSSPPKALPDHNLTSLMIAAREGRLDTVQSLIERGADVSCSSACKRTALHFAADAWWGENRNLIKALLDAGADVHARDQNGQTPMELAQLNDYSGLYAELAH